MSILGFRDRLKMWIVKPRILKTGLAVLVTAWICDLLNWPVIFAVIAAIVSIEPTVKASLQKGKIRLPAAALGAFFAMFFDYWLGQQPVTYALAAVLTIYVCHLLKWDSAIIVATLTAVNMIAVTNDDFLTNFFIRVGTTSVGILVSTGVNFFILPPRFSDRISRSYPHLMLESKRLFERTLDYLLHQKGHRHEISEELDRLLKKIEKAFHLIQYQKEEYRYHRFKKKDLMMLGRIRRKLELLQKINYHISALLAIPGGDDEMEHEVVRVLNQARDSVLAGFDPDAFSSPQSRRCMTNLFALLHELTGEEFVEKGLNKSCSIAYELLAISYLLQKMADQPLSETDKESEKKQAGEQAG